MQNRNSARDSGTRRYRKHLNTVDRSKCSLYRVIDRNSGEFLHPEESVTLQEARKYQSEIDEVETRIQKKVDGRWESLDIDNTEFR
jgi:hypothetical protein